MIDSLSTVIALLSCINIPLKIKIRLQFHPEPGSFPDDYTLLSRYRVAQRFGMSKDQVLSSPIIRPLLIYLMNMSWGTPCSLSVSRNRDRYPFFSTIDWSWNLDVPLHFIVDCSAAIADNEDRIISIYHSIPLPNVHSLDVFQPVLIDFGARCWNKFQMYAASE